MSNYIEPTGGSTEGDKTIQAHLRQACEHKIALHVDAAIDVVDTDPVEADAWAYEAGKEAWEFDLQVPEKLASYPALSAAFTRGFGSVEDAALKAGIYNGQVDLTGPQLMQLLDDMATSLAPKTEVEQPRGLRELHGNVCRMDDLVSKDFKLLATLHDVSNGLDVIEKALQVAATGDPAHVPFPLVGREAQIRLDAQKHAYLHVLEMCSAESLRTWLTQCQGSALDEPTLLLKLQEVAQGLLIIETASKNCASGDLSQATFPLVGEEARLQLAASAEAYLHALEVCNSTSVREVLGRCAQQTAIAVEGRERNLVVDGLDESGCFAGDGERPPFVVFDVDAQENIAGPFASRELAANHLGEILAGNPQRLDAHALRQQLADVSSAEPAGRGPIDECLMPKVEVDSGVDEDSQESGFMNATLQSAGPEVAMSIATSLAVPFEVVSRGQQSIEQYVRRELLAAAGNCEGLRFHVQLGPSREALRELQRDRSERNRG